MTKSNVIGCLIFICMMSIAPNGMSSFIRWLKFFSLRGYGGQTVCCQGWKVLASMGLRRWLPRCV
jgi:hypothetical protein